MWMTFLISAASAGNLCFQSTVGLWVGIANGIEPGDQVIIRGGERLSPGQLVEVIPGVGEASQ